MKFAVEVFRRKTDDTDETKMPYLRYHLSSGLIAFPMIGFLLELLYHSLPGGSVLQSKFGYNPAKLVRLRVLYSMQRYTEP